jgi:hypothetical protein
VHAKISEDLRKDLPTYTRDAVVTQSYRDGVINVKGVEIKADLYAKPIFLEVEIANISHTREIYVVNQSNENQANRNRNTKAEYISQTSESRTWMTHGGDSSGSPQAIYVGRGEGDSSRFIILSPGLSQNTYINIYVKMNNKQYSTQIYISAK